MFKNYFKTAWRNIRKNKLFSGINILGLSIGIATCFIIMLYGLLGYLPIPCNSALKKSVYEKCLVPVLPA